MLSSDATDGTVGANGHGGAAAGELLVQYQLLKHPSVSRNPVHTNSVGMQHVSKNKRGMAV